MKKQSLFGYIPVKSNKNDIMRRLGYRKENTGFSDENITLLNKGINISESLCEGKGIYKVLDVKDRNSDMILLEKNIIMKSKNISKLLSKSEQVVFMASTVGQPIMNRIKDEMKEGSPSLAVVLDASASEMADSLLDYIMDYITVILKREGLKLTKHRFSPGYGDLSLNVQKQIFEYLDLQVLGLELTEKLMLVPEKSVIAIAGIERIM